MRKPSARSAAARPTAARSAAAQPTVARSAARPVRPVGPIRARRRRLVFRSAIWLTLALTAALAAIGWALFTLGSSLTSTIASAELASGAALQANNSWPLPAGFSVVVFAGVVLVAQRIVKNTLSSSSLSSSLSSSQVTSSLAAAATPAPAAIPAPIPFELRRPDLAESRAAGMLRP